MSFASAVRREIGVLAVATGISYAGDFLAATALTLTLQAHGASGPAVAALLFASTAPMVLLAPIAGRIVDRYSSRALLVAAGLGQAVACTGLAFVTSTVAVVGLVALLGAGVAVTGPTMSALVPQIAGREGVPHASATVQTARSLGVLIGPAAAGLLVGVYGQRIPLLVDATSYLAIVAAGLLLRTVRRGGGPVDSPSGRIAGGLALVRRDPLLLGVLILVTAGVAAVTAVNVGSVFLVRGVLHASTTTYGLLDALWSVFAMAGGWLLARRTPGDRGLVGVATAVLVVFGLVLLGVAAVPATLWLVPLYLVGGVANGAFNLVNGVLLGRRVAPGARGRVGAVFSGVANAGTLVGFVAGGLLLQVLAVRTVYVLCGLAALAVVAVLGVPVLRSAARAPAPASG